VACEGIASRWLGKENAFRMAVSWGEDTAVKAGRLLATVQQKPLVEMASIAIAFILARRLLALGQLDLNDYGDRADYRSPSAECVLEVSGTEDTAELGRRHREQVAQALGNTYGWGACAVASGFRNMARRRHDMARAKAKAYPSSLLELMALKTAILMKARTLTDMGMAETAQPIWAAAASYEERIAPLLDALGRALEAAASRISAASCYQKGGDLSRAVNLYQAALAARLRPNTRRDVEAMLAGCLAELSRTTPNGASRRGAKVQAST